MPRNRIIPYRKDLKARARDLRKNSTLSEILLWQELKNRQLLGYQFHRQVPMLNYIVDFYCHELQLAIEVDGDSHDFEESVRYDTIRQGKLEQFNVHVLRFDDLDVKNDMAWVIGEIGRWIENRKR